MVHLRKHNILSTIISFQLIILQNVCCNAFLSYHHRPHTSFIRGNGKQQTGERDCYAILTHRQTQERSLNQRSPAFQLNGLFGVDNKDDTQEDNAAPKRILDIACDSIKVGGLRFALGLYLLGQQNTPSKGSWTANQADDGSLKMYYMDKSAMFSVTLSDNSIAVDRYGPSPSLRYMLQESVALHGLLDELEALAISKSNDGEDEIKNEDRLLIFSEPNTAIETEREKLPARAANA